LGKPFKDTFGHVGGVILGGLVGLKRPENHGVTYSLTEEFATVYRMHSLLPDNLQLRDISATPGPNKSLPLIKEYDDNILYSITIFPLIYYNIISYEHHSIKKVVILIPLNA